MKKLIDEKDNKYKLLFPFKIKDMGEEASDTTVVIEGYANYSGNCDDDSACYIDRSHEVVVPSGVSITNYKKNPVILLNHNRDQVIGKALKVEKKDDGLFITAEIHAGACEPEAFYAISKGLISSFSIGFRTMAGEFKDINGKDIYFITKSELYETSCVTIPCNAASGFSVVKMLDDDSFAASDLDPKKKAIPTADSKHNATEENTVKITLREVLPKEKVKELEDLGLGTSLDELKEIDTKTFIESLITKQVDALKAELLAVITEKTKSEETPAEEASEEKPATDEAPAEGEVEEEKAVKDEETKIEDMEAIKSISDSIASLKALVAEEK